MKVGSLFSGIGGIDLGLERAGMEVAWQCEINPYCRKVLAKHWPDIPCYEDVRNLPDDIEPVDLICGGYPCQPFSLAGGRKGKDDPRHLWPAFAGALRLLRPEWALLENVPGHLSLGFGDVLGDLAEIGYDAEWTCIPAAAVGAPHLRWRLFIVAHTGSPRRRQDAGSTHGDEGSDAGRPEVQADIPHGDGQGSGARVMADASSSRRRAVEHDLYGRQSHASRCCSAVAHSDVLATQRASVSRDKRTPWATEPDVGRVAHGVPSRVDRLRGLGNAVVPQVAELVGRLIIQAADTPLKSFSSKEA